MWVMVEGLVVDVNDRCVELEWKRGGRLNR